MGNGNLSVYKSHKAKCDLLDYYNDILNDWPIPFEEIFIETRCGNTHIIRCGNEDGKPVLFFHGVGNNSLVWRHTIRRLGKLFHLFLVDTINDPGKSEASGDFNAGTDYTPWVDELLENLKIDRASLVGHSKGGWIALNAVIQIPNKIEKIVLLAPAIGITSKIKFGFMVKSLAVGLSPSIKKMKSYVEYLSGPGQKSSARHIEYLSKLITGTRSRLIRPRRFTDHELKNIQKPVLLIFGDHEVCINYHKVIERAKSNIRQLDVHVVPNAGHALPDNNPELVSNLIIAHLEK